MCFLLAKTQPLRFFSPSTSPKAEAPDMFPRFHFVAQMWGKPKTGTKDFEGTGEEGVCSQKKKTLCCLVYIGDEGLPSCVGILSNHLKPY